MWKIILFTLFSALIASSSFADCEKNYYILIHGIGSNAKAFGHMKEALEKQMDCPEVHSFEYDTANSKLSTLDFARSLNELVETLPSTRKNDLNFIMHSQGGLVGLAWVINSYIGYEGFTFKNLERINYFISNSSPFWGSDFALMGEKVFFNLGLKSNFISPFGKMQLEYMKYGSDFFQSINYAINYPQNREFLSYLKNEMNILNVSAQMPYIESHLKNVGSQFFEGDMVVNIPSMTINTNYAKANHDYYPGNIEEVTVNRNHIAEVAYVEGTHMEVYMGTLSHGVINVPESCSEIAECDHDGYLSVYEFLKNKTVRSSQEITEMIKGYELQIRVRLPKSLDNLDDITTEVSIDNEDLVDLSNYKFKGSEASPINISEKDHFAFFLFKGSIFDESGIAELNLHLRHPLLLSRKVKVQVEKGKVTHLDINLGIIDDKVESN